MRSGLRKETRKQLFFGPHRFPRLRVRQCEAGIALRYDTPSKGIIYVVTWDKDLTRFSLAWVMEHYDKTE